VVLNINVSIDISTSKLVQMVLEFLGKYIIFTAAIVRNIKHTMGYLLKIKYYFHTLLRLLPLFF
jgi:hypothetical protein